MNCTRKNLGVNDCQHDEDVGVSCTRKIPSACPLTWTSLSLFRLKTSLIRKEHSNNKDLLSLHKSDISQSLSALRQVHK